MINARNGAGIITAASVEGSTRTFSVAPPTNLAGVGINQSDILWTWMDNSNDEDGFRLKDIALNQIGGNITGFGPNIGPAQTTEFGSVQPNTPRVRYIVSYDNLGESPLSNLATAYTLAIPPAVVSLNHTVNELSNVIDFDFRDAIQPTAWGQGTLSYYRVKLTTMSVYGFSGTEQQWIDQFATMRVRADIIEEFTTWYFHVMSYNAQDTPSAQITMGPYPLFQDIVPPELVNLEQDGAGRFNGARGLAAPFGSLSASGGGDVGASAEPDPVSAADISFAQATPWAPGVSRVHMLFNKPLNEPTINNTTVLVRMVRNNFNQVQVGVVPAYEIQYFHPERQIDIVFAQPGLKSGSLYEVKLTRGVEDVAGNPLKEEYVYYFRTFMNPEEDNILETAGPTAEMSMQIQFPKGSLNEPGSVGAETDPGSFPWGFEPDAREVATQKLFAVRGFQGVPLLERFLSQFNSSHARTSNSLKGPAKIVIPYDDVDNDGYIDQAAAGVPQEMKINVNTLGLYLLDEDTQLWVKIPSVQVDKANKMIVAQVYRLGILAVVGGPSNDVSGSYAYPVPYVAKQHQDIKFTNLPDEGVIKIYAISGELVKEIGFAPGRPDPLSWDVRNSGGEPVAPDVYIYQVESAGNKKRGKIIIVR